ncbi:MAG: cation diffusion facilitator family transporter [Thermoplasmata archaeon]
MEPTQSGTRPVRVALAANLGIFVVKAVSAWLTGSAVLFSETLHSLADSTNSIFLMTGLYLASRPPDREHPFGYGKEVFFWSFVAAMFMLGVISVSSIYRGYEQIANTQDIKHIEFAIASLVAAAALECVAVAYAVQGLTKCASETTGIRMRNPFKAFFNVHEPTLKLIFVEDFTALLGVCIALGAIATVHGSGLNYIDGYAAVVIGVTLGVFAIFLARENREKLIGSAADEGTEKRIAALAKMEQGIRDVLSVKTMFMGANRIIVHLWVELDPDIPLERLDDLMMRVETRIKRNIPGVIDCFIEPVADMDELRDEV